MYGKITALRLKKHNLLEPVSREINISYAKNNFLIKGPKKSSGRHFKMSGTKLCNKIPSYIVNHSIDSFKKYILQ